MGDCDKSKSNTPKRHHYVPKMLLKRFVDDDGWLHFFDKTSPELGVRPCKPASAFYEKHLNSLIGRNGEKNVSLEHTFNRLETAADGAVERVVQAARRQCALDLSETDCEVLYRFIHAQWKRVPDLHRAFLTDDEVSLQLDVALSEAVRKFPHQQCEAEALREPKERKRFIHNLRVEVRGKVGETVLNVMRGRGLAVLHIGIPNKMFVISSHPVVKLTVNGKTNLADPECEMWLPVAHDVAIGLGAARNQTSLHQLCSAEAVRRLNLACISQSRAFAGASASLVRSLAAPR